MDENQERVDRLKRERDTLSAAGATDDEREGYDEDISEAGGDSLTGSGAPRR